MKKIIAACLILCMILTACSHRHSEAAWNVGPQEHRYTCEDCGETIAEAHSTDDEGYCKVCGYTIYDNEDGTYNLMSYDAWGATAADLWVDESGTVMSEIRYENEYDDEGNVLHCMTYINGRLMNETFFEVQKGVDFYNHYLTQEISYDETGKTVTSYNEYMYATGAEVYDADGNLISEEEYTYELDDEGNLVYSASYSDGVMTFESADMKGPDGNMYTEYLRYYAGGELVGEYRHEYEFSEKGDLVLARDFVDGVLAVVGTYEIGEDGVPYLAKEVCYDENGKITDEYHYDSDGNFIE